MADLKGNKKRLLTMNLSLFASSNDHNNNNSSWVKKSTAATTKSPKKSFEQNGVVGLGIVAALNELDHTHDPFFSARAAAILAVSPRSTTPISILNATAGSASAAAAGPNLEVEDLEVSEGYTCVISHIGNNLIKKREYFNDVLANKSENSASYWVSSGVVSASLPPVKSQDDETKEPVFQTADFLNSCNLCKKELRGLDIFIYRGEKAFCSAECRCKQISMDEHKEKCGCEAMKPLEYSVSPCSSPMQFFAGMAAA